MKNAILSITGALFVFGGWMGSAEATEMEIAVEMTPAVEVVVVAKKWDSRFDNYVLENSASN